jgi:hypothetical protein
VTVRFRPDGVGPAAAVIEIESNDPEQPVVGIEVAAEGLPPVIADCCEAAYNLGFSDSAARSATPFAGIAGVSEGVCDAAGAIDAAVAPGGSAPVYAHVNTMAAVGPQSWSLSVEASGEIEVTAATTEGTLAAPVAGGGLLQGGFSWTEVIDPARNAGRRGAVSAAILSFERLVTLPARGTSPVLRLDLAPRGGAEPAMGRLSFGDGLVGSGTPVENVLTVDGQNAAPCNLDTASVAVVLEESEGLFQRGDANNDGRHDISDGVWILNYLFLGFAAPPCPPAADVNGDRQLNVADPSALFNFLFLGGRPPAAPYPDCGPGAAGESCSASTCAG